MFPRFAIPYLIGLATAPVVVKLAKPLLWSTAKATIGIGLQMKKLFAETVEDLQDIAAEASADLASAEIGKRDGVSPTGSKYS